LAIVVWIPQLRERSRMPFSANRAADGGSVWLSALAWQVTLFLGLQSFLFYNTIAWLAEVMVSRHVGLAAAG